MTKWNKIILEKSRKKSSSMEFYEGEIAITNIDSILKRERWSFCEFFILGEIIIEIK